MGKAETAKKMFERGDSLEDVREITGLKTETLEKLQKSATSEKNIEPTLPKRRS
jgi:hypothetical protein